MIYHITTKEEWKMCSDDSGYAPLRFTQEEFVHACLPHQLEGVLHRYFNGQKDLLLLSIDESKLDAEVKYESSGGSEFFPHIYGKITKKAIVKIEELKG